jgi:predicted DNA-binding transcriptional regulator YafY
MGRECPFEMYPGNAPVCIMHIAVGVRRVGGRGAQLLRQWRLLRSLEGARRGLTAAELRDAIQAECSPRTVYRDLELLQEIGFPITSSSGRWRFLESGEGSWVVPVNPTEVMALMLTEDLLAPVEGSWIAEPLLRLRARLSAMMTPTGRRYCAELRRSNIATVFGAGRYGSKRAEIEAIHEAVEKQHRLRIRYRTPGKTTQSRRIDPYCTWFASGRMYLVAFCHTAEDIRTFAVERVDSAHVLDEPFDPDPTFDAAAFTRKGFGVFHGPTYRMIVDFSRHVAHLVRERRYHASQEVSERGRGVRLKMEAAGLPEIAAWLAGFGGDARAIAPPELVQAVARLHRDGLRVAETGQDVTSDDTSV